MVFCPKIIAARVFILTMTTEGVYFVFLSLCWLSILFKKAVMNTSGSVLFKDGVDFAFVLESVNLSITIHDLKLYVGLNWPCTV